MLWVVARFVIDVGVSWFAPPTQGQWGRLKEYHSPRRELRCHRHRKVGITKGTGEENPVYIGYLSAYLFMHLSLLLSSSI